MHLKRAFTLIEMMVVTGIIVLIMTVTLVSFPQLRGRTLIEREAGRVALALRQAQSYALSVREFDPTYPDNPTCDTSDSSKLPAKFPPYGVSFSSSANPKSFKNFGDINCDTFYNSGEEVGSATSLEGGIYISKIEDCKNYCVGSDSIVIGSIDILYKRPDPTTILTGPDHAPLATGHYVKITLSTGDNAIQKIITVRNTGQVSVE